MQVTSAPARQATTSTAARLSVAAGAVALVLLAALHVLSPEFDPSWRMVSEYAFGAYAWLLALMFAAWSLSCVALFFAIRPEVGTLGGKVGLGFLLLAALGLLGAAVFDATQELHGVAALIGMPSLAISALLISLSLVRNPAWSPARGLLLALGNLVWISLALMTAAVFIGLSQTGGEFGPGVLAGWPNRLLVVGHLAWVMSVAWLAYRRQPQQLYA